MSTRKKKHYGSSDVEDFIKKTIEETLSTRSIRLNVYTVPGHPLKVKEYQPVNMYQNNKIASKVIAYSLSQNH